MDRFRAHSLFQPSNLNAAIGNVPDDNGTEPEPHLFGCMLGIPHPQMARLVAVLGFDFIFVDLLHVPTNPETLVTLVQTINFASEGKTVALVRVPSPDSDLLAYALDAGAAGIVFPQVDTPEQAAAAVYKVRHAYNGGMRSISPISLFDGITNTAPPGWTAETIADRNVAIICQIESDVGIKNVSAIAKTPGVNVLMVGVTDLKATLGLPTRNPGGLVDETPFYDAVSEMIATSKDTGVPLMIPAFRMNPDDVDRLRNFRMVVTSVDILNVLKGHTTDLANMKKALLGDDYKAKENGINGYKKAKQNGVNGKKAENGVNGH